MPNIISFEEAVKALKNGAVGVIPTDTLYGLVARAGDEAAVLRLYATKHREHKPGTVIAASVKQLVELGVPARYLRSIQHLWPNPISLETPFNKPEYLHQGTRKLAYRIPNDEDLRAKLEETGPLQTTSVNLPGEPSATNIKEAILYFGDNVDFYVDGGDLSGREPSTIIRVIDDSIEIVRQGALKINEYGEILS